MCSTDGLLENLIFRGSKELIEFFITFPTVSTFSCLKIEHRKKNFHFCDSFYSLCNNKTLIFSGFKKKWSEWAISLFLTGNMRIKIS